LNIIEEKLPFDVAKNEIPKGSGQGLGASGSNAGDGRHIFRDKAIVFQGRLQTDVGTSLELVGEIERMGLCLSVWLR
jgi:hypothetical protein